MLEFFTCAAQHILRAFKCIWPCFLFANSAQVVLFNPKNEDFGIENKIFLIPICSF